MRDSLIKLPSSLSLKGFSLATHVFRYRPDIWRNEEGRKRNYSVEEIEKSVIWHSAIGHLNDPFEVYARSNKRELQEMSDEEFLELWVKIFERKTPTQSFSKGFIRRWVRNNESEAKRVIYEVSKEGHFINNFIDELRAVIAIASFTKICDSRLMWGYYCNGLKGFCVIYNKERLLQSNIILENVRYVGAGRKINSFDFTFGYRTSKGIGLLTDVAKFKHKEWEHENEIRSLYTLREKDAGNGSIIELDACCIDGIIIGTSVSEETKTKILELSTCRGFSVFRADANLEDFCIEVRDYS